MLHENQLFTGTVLKVTQNYSYKTRNTYTHTRTGRKRARKYYSGMTVIKVTHKLHSLVKGE